MLMTFGDALIQEVFRRFFAVLPIQRDSVLPILIG